MRVDTHRLALPQTREGDVVDLTAKVQSALAGSGMREGSALVFVIGSTAAITTIEFEPGLCKDIKAMLDKLIPAGRYAHDDAWGDGNGHSHLRASIIKPGVTVPFSEGKLILGQWQQVVLLELDNKPRKREVVVQLTGE